MRSPSAKLRAGFASAVRFADAAGCVLVIGDALVVEQLVELARHGHLGDDVAAADEFLLHIELRHGRPVGELLDALAELCTLQDVHIAVIHTQIAEDLGNAAGKPALRLDRRSLHEKHDIIAVDGLLDVFLGRTGIDHLVTFSVLGSEFGSGQRLRRYSGTLVCSASACSGAFAPSRISLNAAFTMRCCWTRFLPRKLSSMTVAA